MVRNGNIDSKLHNLLLQKEKKRKRQNWVKNPKRGSLEPSKTDQNSWSFSTDYPHSTE